MKSRRSTRHTYVYCVVAAPHLPDLARVPRGLPGLGTPRVLAVDRRFWAIVADAPQNRYGETAIERRLSNLSWVSRVAVAHERVVEHFMEATAVLPMQLFTIFASDERALASLRGQRSRLAALTKRVSKHDEWGLRVLLDRQRAVDHLIRPNRPSSGLAYLSGKKARRDVSAGLARRARETVASLYDRLAKKARLARRRTAQELPAPAGLLLLDAAFLVPRSRAASFRALATKEARFLAPRGYAVSLTGPWPPFTFTRD